MNKPTKEQMEAFHRLVQQDWIGSVDSHSNQQIMDLAKRLAKRPSMILEAQQTMQAIAWFCFINGDKESSDILKKAGWLLSAFAVRAKQQREHKEANNHEARRLDITKTGEDPEIV